LEGLWLLGQRLDHRIGIAPHVLQISVTGLVLTFGVEAPLVKQAS